MAEVKSPISGGLKVAKRTISADAFSTRALAPPPTAQPDPVTTSLLDRNSLALNTVSGQLQSITQKMDALNGALNVMSSSITTSVTLERQKEIQDQNQERRLAEQQLREGKESIVERKIQSSLVAPVQKISAKASFTLSRLMGFFTTLLAGWLINQGIETIKALSEGNKNKLNDIKDNVIKNLTIIGGIYAGIRIGLNGLFTILSRVSSGVFNAVSSNLFLRPVQALVDGVKGAASKIIPQLKNIVPKVTGSPARSPGPISSPASAISGAVMGVVESMRGEEPVKAMSTNIAAGVATGKVANVASRFVPGAFKLPAALLTAAFGFGPILDLSKKGYEMLMPKQGASGGPGVDMSVFSKPKEGKVASLAFNPNIDFMGDRFKENIPGEKQDFSQKAESGEVNISQLFGAQPVTDGASISSSFFESPEKLNLSEAQITPIKQETAAKVQDIGPLPEPAPTVIPLPPPPAPAPTPQPIGSSGPAVSVPSFSSSNPDNFYTLYSQVNYNVVI